MDDLPNNTRTSRDTSGSSTTTPTMSTNQPTKASKQTLDPELSKIIEATHHDPFSVLGKHSIDSTEIVRIFMPRATEVLLPDISASLQRIPHTDLFEWKGEPGQ